MEHIKGYKNKYEMYENSGSDTFFIQLWKESHYYCELNNEYMDTKFYSFKNFSEYGKFATELMKNGPLYAYELISSIKKRYCKPHLDIEYKQEHKPSDESIEKFINKLKLEIIKIFEEQYSYDLNEKYIFISDSSGDYEGQYKISFHVVISTPDQILYETNINYKDNSAYHLAYLLNKLFPGKIDLRIYTKERTMRTLGSLKFINDKRQLNKYDKTTSVANHYITNYNLSNKYKILENKAPIQKEIKIKKDTYDKKIISTLVDHKLIQYDESVNIIEKMIKGKIDKIKIIEDGKIYYYGGYCLNCKKVHINRKSTQGSASTIMISRNIHNLIEITFGCWKSKRDIKEFKMFIRRNWDCDIQFNMPLTNIGIQKDMIKLKTNEYYNCLQELIKIMKYGEKFEIFIKNDIIINDACIINTERLTIEDIYYKQSLIMMKSYEETNKTGSTIDFISECINYNPKYKECHNKRFIILAVNIATLASIKSRIKAKNEELEKENKQQITCMWYKGKSKSEIQEFTGNVLITTLNSLPKLLNEENQICDVNNYILWNDETTALSQYIQSKTLKDRLMSLVTLEQLIKGAFKCYFTCADLTNEIIKLFNDVRVDKNDCKIIYNTNTRKQKIYIATDNIKLFNDRLEESFNLNERIVILCDSKRKSDYYYFMCAKKYLLYKYNELLKKCYKYNKDNKCDNYINIIKKAIEEQINYNQLFDGIFEEYYHCKDYYKKYNEEYKISENYTELLTIYVKKYRDENKGNKTNDELDREYKETLKNEYEETKKKNIHKYEILKIMYNAYINFYKENCQGIYLINSDNNNRSEQLEELNKTIKDDNIKILICSPSLGIGINLDVKEDEKEYYFDRLFVHLNGKSTTAKSTQQMLNRVRNYQYKEHYIYFDNVNKKELMTDEMILNKMLKKIKKYKSPIIKELRLLPLKQYDSFIHSLYVRSTIDRNVSMSDFKYNLFKEITLRGHRIIYDSGYMENKKIEHHDMNIICELKKVNDKKKLKEYHKKIKTNNKKIIEGNEKYENNKKEKKDNTKKISMVLNLMDLNNVDIIIDSKTITDKENKKIVQDQELGREITENDKYSQKKYWLYKKYLINDNADKNRIKDFLINEDEADMSKLHIKLKNIRQYIINDINNTKNIIRDVFEIKEKTQETDHTISKIQETDHFISKTINIHEFINCALIKMGFKNGMRDNSILKYIKYDKLTEKEINMIKTLLPENRTNFKSNTYNATLYYNFISVLIKQHYGLNLTFTRTKRDKIDPLTKKPLINPKTNKTMRENINTHFRLEVPIIIQDYIILRYKDLGIKELNINLKKEFEYTKIHNISGTYESYITKCKNDILIYDIKKMIANELRTIDDDNMDKIKEIEEKCNKYIDEVNKTGKCEELEKYEIKKRTIDYTFEED